MNQLTTVAIVLARTNYSEADRIVTVITPDYGKLRLIAKGVRRVKSKLAGGIELFSISNVTFIRGRGDIGTLVSSRLIRHYSHIVTDINRVQLGYELLKQFNKLIEDEVEHDYFQLLESLFAALDDRAVDLQLIHMWFRAQLLRLGGHSPNLQTNEKGVALTPGVPYIFNFDTMAFNANENGSFMSDHIKFLRLLFAGNHPKILQQIQGYDQLVQISAPLVQAIFTKING